MLRKKSEVVVDRSWSFCRAQELLAEAQSRGIELWTSEEKLAYRASSGSMTAQFLSSLRTAKDPLLEILSGPSFEFRPRGVTAPILPFYQPLWEKIQTGVFDITFSNGPHWVVKTQSQLDLAFLRRTIDAIANRHAVLGARVVKGDLGFELALGTRPRLIVIDMSDVDSRIAGATHGALVRRLVWTPFEYASETLFRPFAVKLSGGGFVVGFVLNHFVGDGWSVRILAGELFSTYLRIAGAAPDAETETPALQYGDYVTGLVTWMNTSAFRYRLSRWIARMRGAQTCELPFDHEVKLDAPGTRSIVNFKVPADGVTRMRELAAACGTSLFMVFLAAHVCALCAHHESSEVVLLSVHHYRDDPKLWDMVGSTQNQLALRLPYAAHHSFRQLANDARETCNWAYANQIPYCYLRDALRDLGDNALFPEIDFMDVSSSVHSQRDHGLWSLEPLEIGLPDLPATATRRNYPGHAAHIGVGTEMTGSFVYLSHVYRRDTIRNFLRTLLLVLELAHEDPDAAASTIISRVLALARHGPRALTMD